MSTIGNKKTFEELRERCEDKNTLTQKGSLYVGTGTQKRLSNGVLVYKTEAVTPPSSNFEVLTKNDSATGGLGWTSVVGMLNAATTEGQNTHVKDSNNVKSTINGKNISDIFDSDGVTVKNAIHANTADNADWADGARNANFTDFTNADWIDVTNADTGATGLVEGATYEVVPYKVYTNSILTYKTALAHGFITYDADFASFKRNDITINNEILVSVKDATTFTLSGRGGSITRDWTRLALKGGVLQVVRVITTTPFEDGVWGEKTEEKEKLKFKYRRIR